MLQENVKIFRWPQYRAAGSDTSLKTEVFPYINSKCFSSVNYTRASSAGKMPSVSPTLVPV